MACLGDRRLICRRKMAKMYGQPSRRIRKGRKMGQQKWTVGRLGALAFVIGFWSNTVLADPIPEEILAAQKDECQLDCEEANDEELCEALCSCAVKRFDRKFDYQAFLEFKQQMASGLISDDNQNFSQETGLVCAMEAEQLIKARKNQTDRIEQ